MLAKTFKGLEQVLAKELIELGANNVQIERRAVSFTGDLRMLYTANFCLRTASRVLVPIASFKAQKADDIYSQVKALDWSQYMTLKTTFQIDATVYSDFFRHSQFVTCMLYKSATYLPDNLTEIFSFCTPSAKSYAPNVLKLISS